MWKQMQHRQTPNKPLSVIFIFTLTTLAVFFIGCSSVGESVGGAEFDQELGIELVASETPTKIFEPERIDTLPAESPNPESPTPIPQLPPSTPTPVQTSTRIPTSTSTATATIKPSPTMAGLCRERVPSDDLLTLVTSVYGISREYTPDDLVNLADYLPLRVTLGYDNQLRRAAAASLLHLVADMQRDGLSPQIISGYRSYAAQAGAWQKWLDREPERAAMISVPPGHSEHQLGTTVDFGSPELSLLLGDDDVEFHTYFYKTSESIWLENHAHEYGFSLSYPLEAYEVTGFYYEPWHYRYIGPELASQLREGGISLTQYLLDMYPPPCEP
jgi:D-alanyl-D-alanine carboxypeptidase